MADLKNIVNTKLSKLSQDNITLAKEKCSQADQNILKVRDSGGKDNELVIEAFNLYQESLKLYSKMAQPYIGLAYISYSSGDIETAIGLLNKAYEIEPLNEQVEEMRSLFIEQQKHKHMSSVISKVAGKSLSEKLKTDKKPGINFFGKITSLFIKSTKAKNSPFITTNPDAYQNQDVNQTPASKGNAGNFFENIRNLSPKPEK